MIEYFSKKCIRHDVDVHYYLGVERNMLILAVERFSGMKDYYYRKLEITLNINQKHADGLEVMLLRELPKYYFVFGNTRKLAVFSKVAVILISNKLDIPLYRIVTRVISSDGFTEKQLSTNAFIKSAYRLAPRVLKHNTLK